MGETEQLASFALDPALRYLPDVARSAAAACLLDSIGCALGGFDTRMGKLIRDFASEQGGKPTCSVVGNDAMRLPPMLAALVNGQLANVLDFDDTYLDLGHTGTAVIPAALAVAEQVDASGDELRAAIVAGYEVANRIGLAARASDERYRALYPVGWHSFGATAAAGRLVKLDQEGMENAFGITLEHMQVATTVTPETVHGFKAGKLGQASAIGVMAASLAARGFEGKRQAVDSDGLFWLAMGADRLDPNCLTDGLGSRWTIAQMSFKPYPSCRMTHSALEAAAVLKRRYQIEPVDIHGIRVRTFSRMLQLMDPEPASPEAIPFSLPSTMGMLFRGIEGGAEWTDSAVALHPETVAIARRVETEGDQGFDRLVDETGALPAEVSIELVDGRTVTHTVSDAPWGPLDPGSPHQLLEKFLGMATPILGEQAHALAECIVSISSADPPSARELTQFFGT